jgi:hypothetical protein
MPRRFEAGDMFAVRLPDGSAGFGQVLSRESGVMNSVGCAFFPERSAQLALPALSAPIAVLLVTRDALNKRIWPVLGRWEVTVPTASRPYEAFRSAGMVGARIIGSRIIEKFLAAYHGLAPWDDWHDPAYLDTLLLPGVARPRQLVLTRSG